MVSCNHLFPINNEKTFFISFYIKFLVIYRRGEKICLIKGGRRVFFLLLAVNLAIYLSSLQLFGLGSMAWGGMTFASGVMMTTITAMFYQMRKTKKAKKKKKDDWIPDCDCDCCE
jgi:hypothetical protein